MRPDAARMDLELPDQRGSAAATTLLTVAALAVLLVFAVPYLVGRYLLTPSWFEAVAIEPLERTLGRDVTFRHAWLGFGSLVLTDVSIAEDPAFTGSEDESFVSVERISLRMSFADLVARRLVFREARLRRPSVSLRRDADGRWNVASLAGRAEAVEPMRAESSPLLLARLRVDDGRVLFVDELGSGGGPFAIEAHGFQLDAGATGQATVLADGELRADAEIELARLRLQDHLLTDTSVRLRMRGDQLTIDGLTATLDAGRIRADGHVYLGPDDTYYNGHVAADDLDLRSLAALAGTPTATAGEVSFSLYVSGQGSSRDEFLASLVAANAASLADGHLIGELDVRCDHLDADALLAVLAERAEGGASSAAENAAQGTKLDRVRLATRLRADSMRLRGFDMQQVSGRAALARGQVRIDELSAGLAGGAAKLTAQVDIVDPGLPYEGRLVLQGGDIIRVLSPFVTLKWGSSRGLVDVDAVFGGRQPSGRTSVQTLLATGDASTSRDRSHMDVRIVMEQLDLNALLGADDDVPSPGRDLGPFDTGEVTADFDVRVGAMNLWEYELRDIVADIRLRESRLQVARIAADAAGGVLDVAGELDLMRKGFAYEGAATLENADVIDVLRPIAQPSWGENVGVIDAAFDFTGQGTTARGALDALRAEGEVAAAHGRVFRSELFSAVGEATGIEGFDDLYVTDAGGPVRIENARVSSERLVVGGREARFLLSGSLGFDGTLDLDAWVGLGPGEERKLLSRGIFLPYVKDSGGWTNIPTIVEGTLSEPEVRVPYEAYAETAVRAVPDAAGRIVKESAGVAKNTVIRGGVESLKLILGGLDSVLGGAGMSGGEPQVARKRRRP